MPATTITALAEAREGRASSIRCSPATPTPVIGAREAEIGEGQVTPPGHRVGGVPATRTHVIEQLPEGALAHVTILTRRDCRRRIPARRRLRSPRRLPRSRGHLR